MSVFGDLDIPEYNPAQTRDLDKTTWDWLWRSPGGADVEEGEAGTAYYDESGQYRAGEWYVPEGALERREEWLSSIPSWAESEYKIKAESQGKTLNEFIRDGGELDVVRPLQIAALQQGLEYIAVGKITKALGGKNLVKTYGKKLAKHLSKRKNLRIGLDIISTGGVEAATEMGQYGLGEYNKALAEGKVSGKEVNFFETVGNAMFSDEGIESGLQGFFGGGGLRAGGYSAKAMNNMRKKVDALDVEKDFTNLINKQ